MKHFVNKYRTTDNLELFVQGWEPQDNPRAVICLVHGLGEHSNRYIHLAEYLTGKGFAFNTFDLRGHGKSQGKMGHTSSYKALLDDIRVFLDKTSNQFPGLTQFLYGHSLGGNLVINYALRRKPKIKGIIVTSPWLRLSFEPPAIKVAMGKIMNKIWPSFTQSSELDIKALSRDPEVIKAYENDPLVHDHISARLSINVYQAGLWALEHANELEIPLLLMHGSADEITSPAASNDFAKGCAGEQRPTPQHEKKKENITFKIWEGFYHELHNEPQKQEVFSFLLSWLESIIDH